MSEPRFWTPAELEADAARARGLFRQARLDEPLSLYSQFFEAFVPVFTELIDRLPNLVGGSLDPAEVADLVATADARTAFRYLAAPPVSEDDLKTLAETTLARSALRGDVVQARHVQEVVLHVMDPHRFPWLREGREPTEPERTTAIVASAVLVAARKVETSRRSDAKQEQEARVKQVLAGLGLVEVPRRDIPLLDAAPEPGEFCGESRLGGSRADIVVRLLDGRVMAVECKASNSAVNSFKRVNHEALGKAKAWIEGFGKRQIVPCAVIGGVFNPSNLEAAQAEGLAIVWSHRLDDLHHFIEAAT